MKNNNTIKIKNELPELLEAVCEHKDCPEWWKDGIWNLFNEQHTEVTFSADYWRAQFEAIFEPEPELKTVGTTGDALDAEVLQ